MSAVNEKSFVSSPDSPSLMSQLKQNPIVPIGKFYIGCLVFLTFSSYICYFTAIVYL